MDVPMFRTKVGDRYVSEQMRQRGCNVGGEQSGHIILSDYTTTGDGLIAALQVLAVVATGNRPVSEACHLFEPMPQILKNVRYNGIDPLANDNVQKIIHDNEERLGTAGRLVIRRSGTEPLIRVMAEGADEVLVTNVVGDIVDALDQASR
jgi:phosphoglucosamine mutase